jgi:hypothetical protein
MLGEEVNGARDAVAASFGHVVEMSSIVVF